MKSIQTLNQHMEQTMYSFETHLSMLARYPTAQSSPCLTSYLERGCSVNGPDHAWDNRERHFWIYSQFASWTGWPHRLRFRWPPDTRECGKSLQNWKERLLDNRWIQFTYKSFEIAHHRVPPGRRPKGLRHQSDREGSLELNTLCLFTNDFVWDSSNLYKH